MDWDKARIMLDQGGHQDQEAGQGHHEPGMRGSPSSPTPGTLQESLVPGFPASEDDCSVQSKLFLLP